MGRNVFSVYGFNRGLVSRLGLSRIDIKRLALSAETFVNFVPRVLGSMSLRPGLQYIGASNSNLATRLVPFIFSVSDKALIELTNSTMRIWIDDALLSRASVSTAVTNSDFTSNIAGWTASAGATWNANGYLQIVGDGVAYDTAYQQVTVSAADANIEHALRVVIARGPVVCRVGSTLGGDEYVAETTLYSGDHSLAFTPTGNFYVQFQSRLERVVYVNSCGVEAGGVVTLPTPWDASEIDDLKFAQSGDIVFVACPACQQRMISRRSTRSWSVELYQSLNGPHGLVNTSPTTITASAIVGNVTLTSSTAYFKTTNIGSIFSMTSTGQTVTASVSTLNATTNSIVVNGTGDERAITIVISGMTGGGRTVILERSFDDATWVAVSGKSWTAGTTEGYTDGLDNETVYYRLKLSVVGTAGATALTLSIPTGSIEGVVRVVDYTSATSVAAEVLIDLGSTAATDVWSESEWSDRRGWPSAVALHEGRLFWGGKSKIWGSMSDNYFDYDTHVTTDNGAIVRQLGGGPVDRINWMLSAQRLLIGAQGAEYSARSSALDEPLTPTAFVAKPSGTQGSNTVQAAPIDAKAIFVQRNGVRVYELAYTANALAPDYGSSDLTQLVPTIGSPGIVRIATQRQPDTRVHCIRSDGTVALLVYDRNEEVTCWSELETDGLVEDAVVLPGDTGSVEDEVYYVVARTINGSTVRYIEKWALESECRGGTVSKNADAFVEYSGGSTTVIPNLSHLEGESVVVWAGGLDVGTDDSNPAWTQRYTVSGGSITLSSAVTSAVVGLGYTANWLSTKLGRATQRYETFLNQQQKIGHIGLILADAHPRGIRFGQDFDNLDDMPLIEQGTTVGSTVWTAYDEQQIEFPGQWSTDNRVALRAVAPRAVTVLALTVDGEIHD